MIPPYTKYTNNASKPSGSTIAKILLEAKKAPKNSTDEAVVLMILSTKDSPTFLLKSNSVVGNAMSRNMKVPG